MKQNEINRLKEWASKTFFVPNDLAIDIWDFEAEIDKKISYAENQTLIREKLKTFLKTTKAEIKNEQQRLEFEQLQEFKDKEEEAKRVMEAEIVGLKESKEIVTDKYYLPIEYIKSVARGYNKAFVFLGGAGIGKSFLTRQTLAKENVKFVESRGVNSPLGFYQFLYENNDKDTILVFDDVSQLIENSNAYAILLGVLWEGLASWNSTTGKLKIPKQFVFKGRIIIIANKLKGDLKEFFEMSNADIVKSRCLCYNLEMSYSDLIKMMYLIAQQPHPKLSPQERNGLVEFIQQNSSKTTKGFDLRTQVKAENLYLYDKENWKNLLLPLLPKHHTLEVLEVCIKQNNSIKEAERQFCEETGYSRRYFFKLKNRLTE